MDRASRVLRAAWVAGLALLFLFVAAVQARAAFPGANGLLVVQPANGRGLLLVGADGAHPRQICTVAARCDGASDPVWSPDGSEIAFASPQGSGTASVIYPDGSCLACSVPGAVVGISAALLGSELWPRLFARRTPGGIGRVIGITPAPQLEAVNTDGIGFRPFKVSGSWQQPAWSPTGQLAAVRLVKRKSEVFVIDPRTGSARRLTRNGASSPSWSPDGRRLAVVARWLD